MLDSERHYFAIMLPGRATLKVHCRPPCGLKTAVGLDVSAMLPFDVLSTSWVSFRFYGRLSASWWNNVINLHVLFSFRTLSRFCVSVSFCKNRLEYCKGPDRHVWYSKQILMPSTEYIVLAVWCFKRPPFHLSSANSTTTLNTTILHFEPDSCISLIHAH